MHSLLPILVATLLGAIIGLERQWHQGMAGLRTNALVAASAAAFVHLPIAARSIANNAVEVHPTTLAAAVISGIGFLGAGVILREGMNVRGLNTAATLWGSAAIGAYAGTDLLAEAAGLAAIILGINVLLRPVITQLTRLAAQFSTGTPASFTASVTCPTPDQAEIRAAIVEHTAKAGLHLRALRSHQIDGNPIDGQPGMLRLEFDVMGYGRIEETMERVMASLGRLVSVSAYAWTRTDTPELDPALHPGS